MSVEEEEREGDSQVDEERGFNEALKESGKGMKGGLEEETWE